MYAHTDERYDEDFGFTDTEVREMLKYYETEDHYEEIKSWYDGYQFGGVEAYCPWDVLNHCDKIKDYVNVFPENYWINTSSNDAVKKMPTASQLPRPSILRGKGLLSLLLCFIIIL